MVESSTTIYVVEVTVPFTLKLNVYELPTTALELAFIVYEVAKLLWRTTLSSGTVVIELVF